MKFLSAETIADSVACLRDAQTALPPHLAHMNDEDLGRALWRLNAEASGGGSLEQINSYRAPPPAPRDAQRIKSIGHLVQHCCTKENLENELFRALLSAMWTATCKRTGTDDTAYEAVTGGEDWNAATWGRNE